MNFEIVFNANKIIVTSYFLIIKLMEVNKPDKGVFKGMGQLEVNRFINRKFFPNLRNQHQFAYTHNHPNDYKTCDKQALKKFDKKYYEYTKTKVVNNKSQFDLGTDFKVEKTSENKRCFRKHDFSLPPKPIKQKQEGIGIDEYEQRTGEKLNKFSTTSKQTFSILKNRESDFAVYKYSRNEKFNPITGEFKGYGTHFGFEDYLPNTNKKYKANNFTMISQQGQNYDIITGRKLTHD